jgi:murein DD-endopeptidase MepM/ murein hydrolase activator NlpD
MMQLLTIIMGSMTLGMGQLVSMVEPVKVGVVQQLPADGRVTSEFGIRRHPLNGCNRLHAGVDIANEHGTEITATSSGKVVSVERDRGYGLMVEMNHGYGWTTRYAHLSSAEVKVGDVVRQGVTVGRMGRSGAATGTHLHFEVRHYGFAVNPTARLQSVVPMWASSQNFAAPITAQ